MLNTHFQTVYADVAFGDLKIDRHELYLLMGYGDSIPDTQYVKMIDEMIDELAGCCQPAYGYVIHEGKRLDNRRLQVGDTILTPGAIITSSFREATHVAVFVASVGKGFDEWNEQNKQADDMIRLFFADSIGSVLAEACVAVMKERMQRDMEAQGLFVSNSYSPGYCDWRLVEQQKLFAFFPEQFCGVSLTESCLMLPIKSVSGIIGIGKDVKQRLYSCEYCTMTDCVKNQKRRRQ